MNFEHIQITNNIRILKNDEYKYFGIQKFVQILFVGNIQIIGLIIENEFKIYCKVK